MKILQVNNAIQDFMKYHNRKMLNTNEILRILKDKKLVSNYNQLYQFIRRKVLFGLEFQKDRIIVNKVEGYVNVYSVQEVAQQLGINRQILYQLIAREEIQVRRIQKIVVLTKKQFPEIQQKVSDYKNSKKEKNAGIIEWKEFKS